MADPVDEFANIPQETLLELGRLSLRLSRDAKTRRPFLKQIKEISPNYQLPGDQQVEDLRAELEERRAKDDAERKGREITERLERQRAGLIDGTLLSGRKFDDATVKEIEEKVMTKYGISDYEAGAKLYLSDFKPPPDKKPTTTGSWTFPDIPGLTEDPAKAARDAAHSIIDEFRR
jgi:hypothetical protein